MRYWIWWCDLVQGPFEPDELMSLRAFSEDLLVCMEDRQEWMPAGRVADLSFAVEMLKARRSQPLAPPPAPPQHPPHTEPLQGELFGEAPGQQHLMEFQDEPRGPYAFRRVETEAARPAGGLSSPSLSGFATNPFHFYSSPVASGPAVIELPRPASPKITVSPPPVIRESPVKVEDLPPAPPPAPPESPKEIKTDEKRNFSLELLREEPVEIPYADEPFPVADKPRWLPWILGVSLSLAALGGAGYWVMGRLNNRSAIMEANRLESPQSIILPAAPNPSRHPVFSFRSRAVHRLKNQIRRARAHLTKKKPPITAPVLPGKIKKPSHAQATPAPRRIKPRASPPKAKPKSDSRQVPPKPTSTRPQAASVDVPLPGIVEPSKTRTLSETSVPSQKVQTAEPAPARAVRPPDPWAGKQTDAIKLVITMPILRKSTTIGAQAKAMLQQMHEKELLHAAETGERLYLPDKISWASLQEEGSHYRVYLNFMAWQASGERVQTRSYQFTADLKKGSVEPADPQTQQDLMSQPADLHFKHNPMATDIDSILGGVDTYNKHKVQLMIVRNRRSNREGRKKIEAAMATALARVQRSVVYFRKTYSEKTLANVAKAYQFASLLQ